MIYEDDEKVRKVNGKSSTAINLSRNSLSFDLFKIAPIASQITVRSSLTATPFTAAGFLKEKYSDAKKPSIRASASGRVSILSRALTTAA